MTTRILVACACVLVGLGAIVGVASTAGPPDGYEVFHDRDVRVDLPTRFGTVGVGDPNVIVAVAGPGRDSVQVTTAPSRGRSLAAFERATLQDVRTTAPDAQDLRREDVDVQGADEGRRLTFRNPDGDREVTLIIARDGNRFYTLAIDAGGDGDALDANTVEDSFAITD